MTNPSLELNQPHQRCLAIALDHGREIIIIDLNKIEKMSFYNLEHSKSLIIRYVSGTKDEYRNTEAVTVYNELLASLIFKG